MNTPISNEIITTNQAIRAMQSIQNAMKGEREKSGLLTDAAINAFVKEIRATINKPHRS